MGRCFNSPPKLLVYPRKVRGRKMSIETGRIGEYVEMGCSDGVGLLSEDSARLIECQSISADAEDCQYSRLIVLHFDTQLPPAFSELVGAQLGRRYRRPF